jgi:hypothetical protein
MKKRAKNRVVVKKNRGERKPDNVRMAHVLSYKGSIVQGVIPFLITCLTSVKRILLRINRVELSSFVKMNLKNKIKNLKTEIDKPLYFCDIILSKIRRYSNEKNQFNFSYDFDAFFISYFGRMSRQKG